MINIRFSPGCEVEKEKFYSFLLQKSFENSSSKEKQLEFILKNLSELITLYSNTQLLDTMCILKNFSTEKASIEIIFIKNTATKQ